VRQGRAESGREGSIPGGEALAGGRGGEAQKKTGQLTKALEKEGEGGKTVLLYFHPGGSRACGGRGGIGRGI